MKMIQQRGIRSLIGIALATFSFSCFVSSVAAVSVDVGFVGSTIRFSKDVFYVGDTLRAYARLRNTGDEDVSGLIGFYLGDTLLGNLQPFSAPRNGFDEEVFIDFTVPAGAFNVAARIDSTTPMDTNTANNVLQSSYFTPIADGDRDGKTDEQDNCRSQANADQADTDTDGVGNACDADDDNDTLSDTLEEELGSNPLKTDTDSDTIPDAQDTSPLQVNTGVDDSIPPLVTASPSLAPVTSTTPPRSLDTTTTSIARPRWFSFGSSNTENGQASTDIAQVITESGVSVQAGFRMKRSAWNTFVFEAVTPANDPVSVRWQFGDQSEDIGLRAEHVYTSPGVYRVQMRLTRADGTVAEDQASVAVPAFHIANPTFLAFVGGLFLLTLLALAAFLRPWIQVKKEGEEEEETEEWNEDDER